MFKIIIVDDERATREKLVENIEWSKLNIQVAGDAKDGVEGLELARRVQPDIILLDVRMPKMNGIECATAIRKENLECKIIFLSGFTDKEYLKAAIQLNVVDYIEKPIDLDELHTVLKKTVFILIEENARKIKENEINSKLEEKKALIKQELALSMINKSLDTNALKKQYENIQINVSLNDNYRCILLRINMHKAFQTDADIVFKKEKVLDAINCEFDKISNPCIAGMMDGTHVIIHVWGKVAENTLIIKEFIKRIQYSLNSVHQCDGFATIGVGKLVRGMENIYKSYQNARKSLQKSFLAGYDSINFYDDEILVNESFQTDEINKKLRDYLKFGNFENAVYMLEELVTDIKKQADFMQVNYVKGIFLSMMLQISSLAKESGLNIGNEWNSQQLQWAELLNSNTIDEVADFILEKLKILFNEVEEQKGKSKKIKLVMEFIKEHFGENISVVLIADNVGMSPTYLSTLFKKETGKVLGEYIESVRIEKAKELLKDDRLKLAEVSQMVGYNNPNYFATVFKKVTGVYPSDYRRNSVL